MVRNSLLLVDPSKSVLVYTLHSLEKTIARPYAMYGCPDNVVVIVFIEKIGLKINYFLAIFAYLNAHSWSVF